MSRDVMKTTLPEASAQMEPATVSGALKGNRVIELRDGIYRALQRAVDAFGGQAVFADAMGASLSDTHNRVLRKEDSKGNLQRAFVDHIAHVMTDERAAIVFLATLSDVAGFEPPVQRRRVNAEDIGNQWLKQLNALPPGEREGRRADMAAALGVRAEDLR